MLLNWRTSFDLQDRSVKTTRTGVGASTENVKLHQYGKDIKVDTKVKEESFSMYNERLKIHSEKNSHLKNDGDVEIKVKIVNTQLSDAESKLLEERYFIPIECPESPSKVCNKWIE